MLIKGKIATLTGRRFTVNVPSSQCSVRELKEMIEDAEGIKIEDQELRRGKTILKDERTLDDYWVRPGSTLLLINTSEHMLIPSLSMMEEGDGLKAREKPKPTETLVLDEEEAKKLNPNNKEWWERDNVLSGPSLSFGHHHSRPAPTMPNPEVTPNISADREEQSNAAPSPVVHQLGGDRSIETTTGYAENSVEHRREVARRAIEARLQRH